MRRFKYILILSLSLLAMMQQAWAQDEGKDVRRGNRDFRKENWKEAEIDYRKALVKDSLFMAANYNLANTLYRVEDFEQARKIMENVSDIAPASESAADYYYNLGDIAIALQDWQGAVDAFKESLLLNPWDINAKENYLYAKKMLGEQQNQEQQDAPAQEKKKYPTREEIQSQKIAFFTQELDLSPQEAQQFWPVYNEGWKKSHDARKEINRTLKALNEALKSDTATDKEIEALMARYFAAVKAEAQVQEETYKAISKVLPVKKAAKTSTLEEKFRVMLIKQLRR